MIELPDLAIGRLDARPRTSIWNHGVAPAVRVVTKSSYRIRPGAAIDDELRRIAVETLTDAIALLDDLHLVDAVELESRVHRVRKHCKESRGLLRLAAPAIGRKEFRTTDRLVRDAARELSGLRDAHVLLRTVARLGVSAEGDELVGLEAIDAQLRSAPGVGPSLGADRIAHADELLRDAVDRPDRWAIDEPDVAVTSGLGLIHGASAAALGELCDDEADDDLAHEWRREVKYLWYQVRLLEPMAPSMLAPLVATLDALGESLGDDHDLGVLVERIIELPDGYPQVVALARDQQRVLRSRAIRVGRSLHAEDTKAFVARVGAYVRLVGTHGRERRLRSLPPAAELAHRAAQPTARLTEAVERERRFLVEPSLVVGTHHVAGHSVRQVGSLEQGYLALDHAVSVRVRRRSDGRSTMTVKAGSGARRTEVERELTEVELDELWGRTEGRRVVKTRLEVPIHEGLLATIDVFAGHLAGLVMVEVEFDDDAAMAGFVPPPWFGLEVTDDPRYANARLAVSPGPPAAAGSGDEA